MQAFSHRTVSLYDSGLIVSRRQSVRMIGGLPAAAALAGCESILGGLSDTCPGSPAEGLDVNWIADVAHPVAAGSVDIQGVPGSHRTMAIHYPAYHPQPVFEASFSTSPVLKPPPMLRLCGVRYPVILFLHGNGPSPVSLTYQKWRRLPAALARSGYIVVVPSHSGDRTFSQAHVDAAQRDLEWVRSGWDQSNWVSKRPQFGVAGHSNGALQAFYLALRLPEVISFALLSANLAGDTFFFSEVVQEVVELATPKSFVWARNDNAENFAGYWTPLKGPKYEIAYDGRHFDYFDPEDSPTYWSRGPCDKIRVLAPELVALFFASTFISHTQVPTDLRTPHVVLSTA